MSKGILYFYGLLLLGMFVISLLVSMWVGEAFHLLNDDDFWKMIAVFGILSICEALEETS